jgi:hypothetical protein
MSGPKYRRWLLIVGVVVVMLTIAGVAAMHFAARSVKESIQEALGPEGEAAEIKIGLTSIELLDVRIKAPRGWPSDITKLKSGIDSGSFNLDLRSRVKKNFVTASGTLTVIALKLKPGENPLMAIAALPRDVSLGALENEQHEITVPFKLQGDLADPTFSLTGEGTLQTAVAIAKAFGTSFEGLVRAFLIIVNGFASAFRA